MINLVNFQANRFGNIMPNHFKVGVVHPVDNVALVTGVKVVEADDIVLRCHQPIDEMRADEASTSSDQNSHRVNARKDLSGKYQRVVVKATLLKTNKDFLIHLTKNLAFTKTSTVSMNAQNLDGLIKNCGYYVSFSAAN